MVYILHKVAAGEDGESIARLYNIPPCVVPRDIRVGHTLKISTGGHKVEKVVEYIIKPMDTLSSIARRFKVDYDKILRGDDSAHPFVGEKISIIL